MRFPIMLVAAFGLSSACVVPVVGAPCTSDDNCPSAQYCVANSCSDVCHNSPTCVAANVAACDPNNSNNSGKCVDVGGGCLRLQTVSACPLSGDVCDAGVCACPLPSVAPVAGAGCLETNEARCADPGTLLTCVSSGGCKVWTPTDCATSGLFCNPDAGTAAACQCPALDGGPIYVDPVRGTSIGRGLIPTGLHEPSHCRYRSLSEGVSRLPRDGTVVLSGWPFDAWAATSAYSLGSQVRPSTANGHQYKATQAGDAGTTEPSWPTGAGATVADGTVVWSENGPDYFVLSSEHFPIVVPSDATVTTSDCSAGGGTGGCDARKYVLPFGGAGTGADTANAAIVLTDGGVVEGMTIVNVGSQTAASAVLCSSGLATLDHLHLYGTGGSQVPPIGNGIAVSGDCAPTIHDVSAGLFGTAGIQINTTGVVTLKNAVLGGDDGGALFSNVDGIDIVRGSLTATNVLVADNLAVGINDTSPAPVTVYNSEVRYNGWNAAAPALSQPGILVTAGTLNLDGVNVHDNGGDGVQIFGSGTTTRIGNSGSAASNFSFNGRTTDAGIAIGSGISAGGGTISIATAVTNNNGYSGLSVSNGAQVTSVSQVANQNEFDGVTIYAGSMAQLSNATLTNNLNNGLFSEANASTLVVDSATITGNGHAGVYAGGPLIVDGGTPNSVLIGTNGSQGVVLLSSAWVANAEITGNANAAGILVDSRAPVSVLSSKIHVNGSGVDLMGTSTAAASSPVALFLGDEIASNYGPGIRAQNSCTSGCPSTNASVISCSLHDNQEQGIVTNPQTGPVYTNVTFEQMIGNDITNNARSITAKAAGIYFGSKTSLTTFQSNKVHNNKGPQVWISTDSSTSWNLDGVCGTTPNLFYGYGPSCGATVGLRDDSTVAGTARHNSWVQATPQANVDFIVTGVLFDPGGPCAPVPNGGVCQ